MLISTAVTLLIMAGALLSLIYLLIYLFISLRGALTGSTKDSDETLFLSLSEKTLLTAIKSIYPHQQSDGGVQIAEEEKGGGGGVFWGGWGGRSLHCP